MAVRRLVLLAACAATATAAAAAQTRPDWNMVDALEAAVAGCPAAQLSPGARASARAMHVPDPSGYVQRQLAAMIRADPDACPGVAAEAASRLRALVGEPERADVPVRFLALLRIAAEEGLGMERDGPLADRLGRIQWLLDHEAPEIPRWSEAERNAWMLRPETLALLQDFVARFGGMNRQTRMLAELRLRRDLPLYDPKSALVLLEQALEFERLADLLSDGDHIRPDYRRAAAPILELGMFTVMEDQQRALLLVGRRAAAAARTDEERALALRILFAAAVEDIEGSCALVAEQLRPFSDAPLVAVAPDAEQRIREEMGDDFDPFLVSDDVPDPRPIVVRALIDPAGRVVYARVHQSSGSRDRDRFPIEAWAAHAEAVDLSRTSRGRFVWTDLPPIPQERTTTLDPGPATGPPGPC